MAEKSGPRKRERRFFMRQPMMLRVVYALAPLVVAGVYFFGWRVAALLGVNTAAGLLAEWAMERRRGRPVSQACLVTCVLYTLSLPPTMPFWMSVVGVVVGIVFGKEVFGGFGRNFANPAIVGRAFVYVAFPVAMTGSFVPAFRGFPGGFSQWSLAARAEAPGWLRSAAARGIDAVTSATPRRAHKEDGYLTPLPQLLLGHIGGVYRPKEGGAKVLAAGSIGEVCTVLIVLGGIYLMATRTSNWRLTAGCVAGGAGANVVFRNILGASGLPPLAFGLTAGSLLFVAVFMVTDPVSAPRKKQSVWVYGVLVGVLIVVMPWKGQFSGAASFAILLANVIGPSLDLAFGALGKRKGRKSK